MVKSTNDQVSLETIKDPVFIIQQTIIQAAEGEKRQRNNPGGSRGIA